LYLKRVGKNSTYRKAYLGAIENLLGDISGTDMGTSTACPARHGLALWNAKQKLFLKN
jgi:hypothetical protein